MDQEEDGISALHSHKKGSIYYVVPSIPPFDDIVIESLHKQDKRPNDFLVTGDYGKFNTFFSALETSIKERNGQNQVPHTSHPNVTHVNDASPSQDHPGEQSPVSDEKVTPQLGPQQPPKPNTTRPLPVPTDTSKDTDKPSHSHAGMSADVLLVTVTDVEAQAIFDLFPNRSQRFIDGRIYYDLGVVGTARTFMAQSTGAGPAPTRICIEEAIQALSPPVVIMVGIAFGLHPKSSTLGIF